MALLLWIISELLLLWQDLWRLKDPSDTNSALQETGKASTTPWMGWRLGQVVDHIHHHIHSFLQTLNVGDRHGARDPLAECPGEDLLSNFLHF